MHTHGKPANSRTRIDAYHVPIHSTRTTRTTSLQSCRTPRQEHGEAGGKSYFMGNGVDTSCIPPTYPSTTSYRQAKEGHQPSRSATLIKLGHNLPTSDRPDHFHDTNVHSRDSLPGLTASLTDYRFGTYGIVRQSSGPLPRPASNGIWPGVAGGMPPWGVSDPSMHRRLLFFQAVVAVHVPLHITHPGSKRRIDSLSKSVWRLSLPRPAWVATRQ